MKKVLFGTTALVLSAGVAFAEAHGGVSVGGGAGIWVGEKDGGNITVDHDINIDFSASGETDGGLGFGMDYTFLEDGSTDNSEVYISGSWGKLAVGDTDDALQMVAGIGDIGFDGLGVDNVAEQARGDGSANGVLYSNTFGAVSLYLSHNVDLDNDDVAAGVKFAAGDITIGIGYEDQGAANGATTAVDLSGSFGSIGFDVYYEDSDALGSGYGTIVSFDAGAATIKVGYADHDNVADAAVGVGFSTDLGGGAELAGGYAQDADGNDNWDLGISMSF